MELTGGHKIGVVHSLATAFSVYFFHVRFGCFVVLSNKVYS